MGANQSAVYASNGANESFMPNKFASKGANESFMPKKTGQVLIFRSSSKWNSHFQSSKETNKLMVIHFTATWCGPCRAMEPIIRDFAAKYVGVEFIQIDVDELEGVAKEYAVQALPAFVLIKKGKAVDKVVGAEKAALQKKIEKYMV
ncbi:putative monodehydroascorbate reductase (NADH) [Heracleum sosnowskyi]|uniref:Monodehydroascorbate reductase (NADH) n=1 Tax=Heracleum sosnowskyi TaxID=360622 RepID=A0AAD8GMS7_9APIA|nr:putative monodehydroascorbate reductase (NADH) [Heracleum sosnowskyi]